MIFGIERCPNPPKPRTRAVEVLEIVLTLALLGFVVLWAVL